MIRATFLFLVGTLVFSALLTPPVCSLIVLISGDLPWPFSRVYDRVALVVAVAMLVALRKQIEIGAVKELLLGRGAWGQRMKFLLLGIFLSLVLVLPILPFVVDGSSLTWKTEGSVVYFLSKAAKAVLAGLVISIIEESFFRVVIFQNLKRYMSLYFAALLCSVLYAVVHFIRPDKSFEYTSFAPLAGFDYTLVVIQSALWWEFLPAFFGLVIVGLILCYVIQKTSSLYLCIGLHSGWVIAMKMTHYGTDVVPGSALAALGTRRYDLVSQPEVWVSFAITFLALVWVARSVGAINHKAVST